MMVKAFPASLLKQILEPIDHYISRHPGPYFAAFDADGTLWNSDVGENFFQYQIDHCQLSALKNLDPWAHYLELKKKHPPDAYLWLAQICHPHPISAIRNWAQLALQKFPLSVLEPQKNLIAELLKRKFQIFVVSASTHWAVEAAMSLVQLPPSSAIGVKTKVLSGHVTLDQDGPITWRQGKAQALLDRTQGISPLFCSGNSSGDIHLLEMAQLIRLAVQTQSNADDHPALYADEQKLFKLATENNWLTHSFFD